MMVQTLVPQCLGAMVFWDVGVSQVKHLALGLQVDDQDVVQGRVGPDDFLATIYRHLGIDFERVSIPDFSGRPIPLVKDGRPIAELVAP